MEGQDRWQSVSEHRRSEEHSETRRPEGRRIGLEREAQIQERRGEKGEHAQSQPVNLPPRKPEQRATNQEREPDNELDDGAASLDDRYSCANR